ncbi:MAG: hypothetical protein KC912_24505, partial [Proteobacteria bacterium]|nr:hypothetical protein [Pseudomonadota bacterium]
MSPQVDPIDVPATLQKAAEMCASGRDRTAFDLLEAAVARSDDPRLALAAAKIALAWDSDRALLLAELAVSRGSADQDVYRVLATALDSSGEWTRAHRLRIEADLSPSRAYRRHRRRQVLGIVAGTAAAAATLAAIAAIVLWPSISLDGWGENATHIVADRAALNAPPGALELELTPPMLAVSGRTV